MTGDQDSIVKDLISRVHLLMEKHTELIKQFGQLKLENDDLQSKLSEQTEQIENIELQYKTAKIATNVLTPLEDKEEARGQINRIVREIDDCIALLNR